MKKIYVVVYRDDTNDCNSILGTFNNRENALKCLWDDFELVKRVSGNRIENIDKDAISWGINYNGAYYDTCEILEVDAPNGCS